MVQARKLLPSRFLTTTLLMMLALVCLPGTSRAEGARTVIVPWSEFQGVYEELPDGTLTGFFGDLTRQIADRAGLTVEYRHYDTFQDALFAMAEGQADLMAGVARLPLLQDRVLFSDQTVAETAIHLYARTDAPADLTPRTISGARIGVISSTAGSDMGPMAFRNTAVRFLDPLSAFVALLAGEVDGVVTLNKAASDTLLHARLDQRIRIAGPAIRTVSHAIALNPRRADLMPAIDAAIEDMRADGELLRLLHRWNMTTPPPEPEVLIVGVTDFPPYQVVRPDGSMTGFGVETLRALGARSGLKLAFRQISTEDWANGPGPGRYDLLPPISMDDARRSWMDFTRPVQESPYSIFTAAGAGKGITGLDDLTGKRVGVAESNVAREVAARHGGLNLRVYPDADAVLRGLLDGEVDAILHSTITIRELAAQEGVSGRIEEVKPAFFISQRAIALRPGLGRVREALNAAIPAYLSSEEYQTLRADWLATPGYWTRRRVTAARAGGVILILFIAAGFVWQSRRGRRRALDLAQETHLANDRLQAILNAAGSGILGFARDGRIVVANPGARRMLRLGGQPLPTSWPTDVAFVEPDSMVPLDASRDPVRRALAGATLGGETALMRTGDAPPAYIRIASAHVEGRSDLDPTTVVVLDDVTDREHSRQQAERAARLEALGQLTGGVAHDFNNILATIDYAAKLTEDHSDADGQRYLGMARNAVRRGADLTKQLMAFARRQPGLNKSYSVRDALTQFSKLAQSAVEETITVEITPCPPDLHVFCDIAQLENALMNLVLNARDAILGAHVGDRILISVRTVEDPGLLAAPVPGAPERAARYVEFSVSDNGPGMTEEVRRRATDPFFTTKTAGSGSGLGLSIVYGFAQQSDGDLKIYSEPGQGTTIRLLLPRGTVSGPREAPKTRRAAPRGTGERILVVEDEPDLLEIINAVLTSLGYEVSSASSGRAALDLVNGGEGFDLVLSDVVMPGGIGGFELARELRDIQPDLPIVYMSGYTGISEKDMGVVVAPTLQKPCDPAELAETLRQELDRASGKPGVPDSSQPHIARDRE